MFAFGEVDAGDIALGVGGPSNEARVGKENPDERALEVSIAGTLAGKDGRPDPEVLDLTAPNTEGVTIVLDDDIGNLGGDTGGDMLLRPSSSDPDSYKQGVNN